MADKALDPAAFLKLSPDMQRNTLAERDPAVYGRLRREDPQQAERHFNALVNALQARQPRVIQKEPESAIGRWKQSLTQEPPPDDPRNNPLARGIRAAGDVLIPGDWAEAAVTAATLPIGGRGGVGFKVLKEGGASTKAALTGAFADLFKPSSIVKDAAKRAGVAGVVGGGVSAMSGGNALDSTMGFAFSQALGEAMMAPLRLRKNAQIAKIATEVYQKAKAEFDRAVQAGVDKAAAQTQFNKAMANALNQLEGANYKKALAEAESAHKKAVDEGADKAAAANAFNKAMANALNKLELQGAQKAADQEYSTALEDGAKKLTSHWKKVVPSWKKFPDGQTGVMEMVYGKGPEEISKVFDKGLKQALAKGEGRAITILAQDAEGLGLKNYQTPATAMGKPGLEMAVVNAGDVIQAVVGKWKDNPTLYHRVATQLEKQGIGNEKARREYRAGKSLIEFVSKNNVMKGGVLDPEAALKGLSTSEKNIRPLRGRGQGDFFRGPMADVARIQKPEVNQPTPHVPRTVEPEVPVKPDVPEPPMPHVAKTVEPERPKHPKIGDIETRKLKNWHPYMIGELVTEGPMLLKDLLTGETPMRNPYAHGLSAAAGLGLGAMMPHEITTRAPLRPKTEAGFRIGAAEAAQGARELSEKKGPKEVKIQLKKQLKKLLLDSKSASDEAAERYAQSR